MSLLAPTHLATFSDAYGAPLAEYYYFPENSLLYVRWHGQLTAAEVVKGAAEAERLMRHYRFQRMLNDKRDTGGDWSEALPWLQYEWLPQAVADGLVAVAYILSPDLNAQLVSQQFLKASQDQLNVALFTSETEAEHWIRTH